MSEVKVEMSGPIQSIFLRELSQCDLGDQVGLLMGKRIEVVQRLDTDHSNSDKRTSHTLLVTGMVIVTENINKIFNYKEGKFYCEVLETTVTDKSTEDVFLGLVVLRSSWSSDIPLLPSYLDRRMMRALNNQFSRSNPKLFYLIANVNMDNGHKYTSVCHLVELGGGHDPWTKTLPVVCPNLGTVERNTGGYRSRGQGSPMLDSMVSDINIGLDIDVKKVTGQFSKVNKRARNHVVMSSDKVESRIAMKAALQKEVSQLRDIYQEKLESSKEMKTIRKMRGSLIESLEVILQDENMNVLE